MARNTDPREDKLPAWARDIIADLRRKNEQITADLEQNNSGHDGRVKQNNFGIGPDVFFDSTRPVRFKFGPGAEDYIDVSLEGDSLNVRGLRSIEIRPWASNMCLITLQPR